MSRVACLDKFGELHGAALYKRFHTMKTKAKHMQAYFHWKSFDEFWIDLMERIPNDYHPTTHRLRFDPNSGDRRGYRPETMTISRTGVLRQERIETEADQYTQILMALNRAGITVAELLEELDARRLDDPKLMGRPATSPKLPARGKSDEHCANTPDPSYPDSHALDSPTLDLDVGASLDADRLCQLACEIAWQIDEGEVTF